MQLIVLGMHRSGTSMLARLLNLMGGYFGPEGISTGANPENAKGFWERRDIRALNDLLLQSAGCDWNRMLAFKPEAVPATALEEFNERASRLVLEMDAHRPWLIKEPRLCLLLEFWMKWLEVPVCIHIIRNPVEVASSLRVRNQVPIEAGLVLWERYVRSAFELSDGLPGLTILHRELMSSPVETTTRLCEALENMGVQGFRQPAEREIGAFINQDLYHQRSDSDELRAYADSSQARLYLQMEVNGSISRILRASPEGDVAPLAAYEAHLKPLRRPRTDVTVPEMERVLREKLSLKDEQITVSKERVSRLTSELTLRNVRVSSLEQELGSAKNAAARRIPELERELAEAGHAYGAVLDELASLRQSFENAEQTASDVTAELELVRQAKSSVDQVASGRLQDLSRLTRMLMKRDRRLSELTSAREATVHRLRSRHDADMLNMRAVRRESAEKVGAADKARLSAEIQLAQMRQLLATLRGSRTWRMGRPLRACGRLARSITGRAPRTDLEVVNDSSMFDATWYLQAYPDVAENGGDPAQHYMEFGNQDRRNPGPDFDTARYLRLNADVAASGMNALVHYLRHGKEAGRPT